MSEETTTTTEQIQVGEATAAQISKWKSQYNNLQTFTVWIDGEKEVHHVYIKEPSFDQVGVAFKGFDEKDVKSALKLLKICYAGGSDQVLERTPLILAAASKLQSVLEASASELKKL